MAHTISRWGSYNPDAASTLIRSFFPARLKLAGVAYQLIFYFYNAFSIVRLLLGGLEPGHSKMFK